MHVYVCAITWAHVRALCVCVCVHALCYVVRSVDRLGDGAGFILLVASVFLFNIILFATIRYMQTYWPVVRIG